MISENDSLIDFVASVSGDDFLKVEEDLGDGFVRLKTSEAERRQAKHDIRSVEDVVIELLRNARDAHARRIFVANSREGDTRTIVAIDDGMGVPAHLQERIFDPRVTSKLETMSADRWGVHGRGMALFSIRSNVDQARVVTSDSHKGMAIEIISDVHNLDERTDQSTWPDLECDEDGRPAVVKGPHNIIRRVVEFACDHPDIDVFLGTPTEILSTAFSIARALVDTADLAFQDDDTHLPVWQRPVASVDARALMDVAGAIGLQISERTAHRILADEIGSMETVLEQAMYEEPGTPSRSPDIYADRRSIRIHHSDLDDFKRDLLEAFDTLADRYYLTLKGEPGVTIGKSEIKVRFQIDKQD